MHIGDIWCHGMGSEVVVSEWGLEGRPGGCKMGDEAGLGV